MAFRTLLPLFAFVPGLFAMTVAAVALDQTSDRGSAWQSVQVLSAGSGAGFWPHRSSRVAEMTPAAFIQGASLDRLELAADAFRRGMSRNPRAYLGLLETHERSLAEGFFGEFASGYWQYFFSGAVVILSSTDDRSVRVGFFNPIIDGIVALDLRPQGAGFVLTGLEAATGETLRGAGPVRVMPAWMARPRVVLPSVLQEVTAKTFDAFRSAPGPGSAAQSAEAIETIRYRTDQILASLKTLADDPAWARTLSGIDPRLAPGAAVAMLPAVRSLSRAYRQDLRPVLLLRAPSNMQVVFGNPDIPHVLLIADVDGSSARPTLGALALATLTTRKGQDR